MNGAGFLQHYVLRKAGYFTLVRLLNLVSDTFLSCLLLSSVFLLHVKVQAFFSCLCTPV